MGIVKSFKDSFHLFKDNPLFILPHLIEYILDIAILAVFGIFAMILIGVGIFRVILSSNQDPETLLSHLGASGFLIVFILIFSFFILILVTTLLRASSRAAIIGIAEEGLASKKTSLNTGWLNVKKHSLKVVGFIILLWIIIIPLIFLAFIPVILISLFIGNKFLMLASVFLSMLLTFLFLAVVYTLIMFTPQFIVLDSEGILDGVKRSYGFVKNNVLSVLGYIIIAIVISVFVYIATSILFFPLHLIARNVVLLRISAKIFENLFSILIGLILVPYLEIVKTHMVVEWKNNV